MALNPFEKISGAGTSPLIGAQTAKVVKSDTSGVWVASLGDDQRDPVGPCRGAQHPVGAIVVLLRTQEQPWALAMPDVSEYVTDSELSSASEALESLIEAVMPLGMSAPWDFAAAPAGWVLKQGQTLARADYPTFFAARVAAGVDTYTVPDWRNRFPIGAGPGRAIGATGGAETHTLTIAEMPSHAHNVALRSNVGGNYDAAAGSGSGTVGGGTIATPNGGGGAHNNMPPFVATNWIMKVA